MSILLAAVGAVVAALLETSVLPELTIAGAKPDLLFILAVAATMMIGVENGLTWAFVGGLMLDLLTPGRQLGATSLTLLLVVGATVAAMRFLPQRHVSVTVASVFVLGWAYQVLNIAILGLTAGTAATPSLAAIAPVVALSTLLAVPVAAAMRLSWLRFGAHDRMEW
jgi:rod shape-determining protein MreD